MLKDYWYIACRSKDLRKKPLSRQIMDCPLVLFRDHHGKAVVLEDRCRHRNSPLSNGKVCEGTIQCPYHGWRYHGDGSVASIPAKPMDQRWKYPAGVKSYLCHESQGYVWICLSNAPVSAKPTPFPYLGEPGWLSFRMKTRFNAGVDACLENFLDCPHATYVHRGWFRSPTHKKVRVIVRTLEDGAEAEYFEEPREKSAVWSLLAPKKAQMKHTDRFIAPSTSRVDYNFSNGMHYSITSSCTPLENDVTEVFTVITFRIRWFGHLVRLYFKPLSKLIITQDVNVLNAQTNNLRKFGGSDYVVMDTDLLFKPIKHWREAMENELAPPAAGKEECIELCL
jgi:phenylpropionate dioxygenase-like ring-hydroxylating dioxygenase large terminal subunit